MKRCKIERRGLVGAQKARQICIKQHQPLRTLAGNVGPRYGDTRWHICHMCAWLRPHRPGDSIVRLMRSYMRRPPWGLLVRCF